MEQSDAIGALRERASVVAFDRTRPALDRPVDSLDDIAVSLRQATPTDQWQTAAPRHWSPWGSEGRRFRPVSDQVSRTIQPHLSQPQNLVASLRFHYGSECFYCYPVSLSEKIA